MTPTMNILEIQRQLRAYPEDRVLTNEHSPIVPRVDNTTKTVYTPRYKPSCRLGSSLFASVHLSIHIAGQEVSTVNKTFHAV